MPYPGQKYRQENGKNSMPGQGNPNQGYNAPPQQPFPGQGYGQPPMNQNYNQGYGQPPMNQNYNQGNQPPMNQGFPQPGGNMPGGGMPMPGGGMPMPGGGNMPMPGGGMPMPGGGGGMPPYGGGQQFNNGPLPPPYQNQGGGMPPPGNDHQGRQFQYNAPPQPPPQNQSQFNQPPPMQHIPQNQPLPQGVDPNIPVSNFSGRKKALLIGINYFGTKAALRGCINDVKNVKEFICRNYGFSTEAMVILTDDQKNDPTRMPTRANIIQAMRWLVEGAQPNDSFFFHFSGHGSQQKDTDGDEADGYDETICPLDYDKAGMIVDDEMNAIMVQRLPPGCRLTAIFDCCHSGTALDLPYTYNQNGKLISYSPAKTVQNVAMDLGKKYMMGDMVGALMALKNGVSTLGSGKKAEKISQQTRGTMADVVMFSGCDDNQTSADAVEQGIGNTGAMSYALIKALSNNPHNMSYLQLLTEVRGILRGKYTQIPQLSSGRPMDMNVCFNM